LFEEFSGETNTQIAEKWIIANLNMHFNISNVLASFYQSRAVENILSFILFTFLFIYFLAGKMGVLE
jgi:hypothetical protein